MLFPQWNFFPKIVRWTILEIPRNDQLVGASPYILYLGWNHDGEEYASAYRLKYITHIETSGNTYYFSNNYNFKIYAFLLSLKLNINVIKI